MVATTVHIIQRETILYTPAFSEVQKTPNIIDTKIHINSVSSLVVSMTHPTVQEILFYSSQQIIEI